MVIIRLWTWSVAPLTNNQTGLVLPSRPSLRLSHERQENLLFTECLLVMVTESWSRSMRVLRVCMHVITIGDYDVSKGCRRASDIIGGAISCCPVIPVVESYLVRPDMESCLYVFYDFRILFLLCECNVLWTKIYGAKSGERWFIAVPHSDEMKNVTWFQRKGSVIDKNKLIHKHGHPFTDQNSHMTPACDHSLT